MRDVFILTKVLFKSNLNGDNQNRTLKSKIGKIILYIVLYGYIVGTVIYMSKICIESLYYLGYEELFLRMALVAAGLFIIVKSFFSSLSVFFFSKDIEKLVPFPIKPIKIIMAKLNCIILDEYVLMAIFILPIFLVYGTILKESMLFYIMAIFVCLLYPAVFTSIIPLITILIMRFVRIIKTKNGMQYLSLVLMLVLMFGIQAYSGTTATSSTEIDSIELASSLIEKEDYIAGFEKIFISINPAINMCINSNIYEVFRNFAIFVCETLVIYVGISFIMSKVYPSIYLKYTSALYKKTSNKNVKLKYKLNSASKSYLNKEFLNLFRNPIYLMQCVVPAVIFPIIFSIPVLMELKDNRDKIYTLFPEGTIYSSQGFSVLLVILVFMFFFNTVSSTAVSRDGNEAKYMKVYPLSYRKQILYKALPGIILSIIVTVYCLILYNVFIKEMSLFYMLLLFIASLVISIHYNFFMIYIDLKNPKLNWNSEYTVVKQNMNILYGFLLILLDTTIISALGVYLKLNVLISGIIFIYLICDIHRINKVNSKLNKLFENIV